MEKKIQSKEELIRAFIEEPSNYDITVSDNTMLPDKMKDKKSVSFNLKPPTLAVLAKCSIVLNRIPDSLKTEGKEVDVSDAINYVTEMAEVFSILSHGKVTPFPDWYVPFIVNNVNPRELFNLFKEAALKTQSTFFLNSIQIAGAANPMTMIPGTPIQ